MRPFPGSSGYRSSMQRDLSLSSERDCHMFFSWRAMRRELRTLLWIALGVLIVGGISALPTLFIWLEVVTTH